jgi:hypothetical protein
MNNIEILINRYLTAIKQKEVEIASLREGLDAAEKTKRALEDEGLSNQAALPGLEQTKSTRVTRPRLTSLPVLIIELLKKYESPKTGATIYDDVIASGFTSKSSDIRRDVYVNLNRMRNNGVIKQTEVDAKKAYYLEEGGK